MHNHDYLVTAMSVRPVGRSPSIIRCILTGAHIHHAPCRLRPGVTGEGGRERGVRETERDRQTDRETDRDRDRETEKADKY